MATATTSEEQQALRDAIEALYAVFARYPLRSFIDGCPHCIHKHDQSVLHDQDLRKLTADDLSDYVFSALYTWGSAEDFKHFLPRVCELLASGADWMYGDIVNEIIGEKLHLAGYPNWPKAECAALSLFTGAWWRYTLATFPPITRAGDYLCTIARYVDDLDPYLSAWSNTTTLPAFAHLIDFAISDYFDFVRFKRLGGQSWEIQLRQQQQITQWMERPLTAAGAEQLITAIPALERGVYRDYFERNIAGQVEGIVEGLISAVRE